VSSVTCDTSRNAKSTARDGDGSRIVDSGDLATWVGSIGTTGALAVAIGLAAVDRGRTRRENASAQAAQVSAWLELTPFPDRHVVVVIKNQSKSPVNDFCAIVADHSKENAPQVTAWAPGVPPSGDRIELLLDVEVPLESQKYRYELTYEFTDVANRRWRHERGSGLTLRLPFAPPIFYDGFGNPHSSIHDTRPPRRRR
jgi:hypothetical protein